MKTLAITFTFVASLLTASAFAASAHASDNYSVSSSHQVQSLADWVRHNVR